MRKRILSVIIAFMMVLGLVPMTGISAFAAPADSGWTTDSNGVMEYNPSRPWGYDFKGYVNGVWQQVTYKNNGFLATVYNGSGLSMTSNAQFIADGLAIQVDYVVKNNGNTAVSNCHFYVVADTMIAGNDKSTNTIDDGTVIMTDEKTNISFFALSTTQGYEVVGTEYAYVCLMLEERTDPAQIAAAANVRDSAFVMNFPETTFAPGEQKTYTLIVGMGDTSKIADIISKVKDSLNTLSATTDYENETITDLEAGGSYEVTVGDETYQFTASEDGSIPLAGSDNNGKEYDFIGKEITIVQKDDGGEAISDPETIQVDARPEIPASDDPEAGDIEATPGAGTITVTAEQGCEYSIDGGENWFTDDDNDGKVVFEGLDKAKEYTISYRVAASSSNFASETKTINATTLCDHTDLVEVKAVEPTTTSKGNIAYWYCEDCDKYFSDASAKEVIADGLEGTEISKIPVIIKGDGQTTVLGEKNALEFTSDADFDEFLSVEVDGEGIPEDKYTVKSGSTIVTLNADYVSTLSLGEHTIGIASVGGTPTAKFTVEEKKAATPTPAATAKTTTTTTKVVSPQTGDDSNMFLWLALICVGASAVTVLVSRKKYNR